MPSSKTLRPAALLLTLGALAAPLSGLTARADAAPALKTELRKLVHDGVPGATVLVRDDNRTTVLTAGRSSLKPRAAMRKNVRFRVGSITKPMVATVVLQLVQEGRLTLDQSAASLLGDLVADKRITVRDLLAHTSGISEYTEDPRVFAPYLKGEFGHVWTPQQLIGFAEEHPPVFAPGADSDYSNTNYVLLGLIVEKVTGTTLGRQIRTRVFDPLHMSASSFATRPRIRGPHMNGYLIGDGNQLLNVTGVSPSVYWGAGNVISTTRDVADFLDGLLAGKLLPPGLLAQMSDFAPMYPGFEYGLGLSRETLPCGTGVGHGGAVAGYLSEAVKMEDGRTVVVAANSITLDDKVGDKRAQRQYRRLLILAACG